MVRPPNVPLAVFCFATSLITLSKKVAGFGQITGGQTLQKFPDAFLRRGMDEISIVDEGGNREVDAMLGIHCFRLCSIGLVG